MNKSIVIAVTGTPPEKAHRIYGSFSQWIEAPIGDSGTFNVIDATQSASYPKIEAIAGVIITGSAAMVTNNEPWSVQLEGWVRELVSRQVPILGICYGHQLLAQALGGEVGFHPKGREIGTVPIKLTEHCQHDALFSQSQPNFYANVTHAQSVLQLPPNSTLLANNNYEPIHAFRVGNNAWGVQFHPEFTANVMRFYLFERFDSLLEQGLDVKDLFDNIRDTVESRSILKKFVDLCQH